MKSYFPDINVWVALVYRGHQHHPVAASWFERLKSDTVAFCRLTQGLSTKSMIAKSATTKSVQDDANLGGTPK